MVVHCPFDRRLYRLRLRINETIIGLCIPSPPAAEHKPLVCWEMRVFTVAAGREVVFDVNFIRKTQAAAITPSPRCAPTLLSFASRACAPAPCARI